MGCDSYGVTRWSGGAWVETSITLNYDDERWPCLCTVGGEAHNGEPFTAADVRSLAALGAAVVLATHGAIDEDFIATPAMLPPAITAAIERFIPNQGLVSASTTEEESQSALREDARG